MTTLTKVAKKCAVCGKTDTYTVIASTNEMGSSDLDTRPPEMRRSTITYWIQRCPSCGYCAVDVGTPLKKPEMLKETIYMEQLDNSYFPELTNTFLCYSIIQESLGNTLSAVWAAIYGAWIADDHDNETAANHSRKRAVILIKKLHGEGSKIPGQEGVDELIMVDLLRRMGEFDEALKICQDAVNKNYQKMVDDIANFQMELIKKKDRACHKVSEAVS